MLKLRYIVLFFIKYFIFASYGSQNDDKTHINGDSVIIHSISNNPNHVANWSSLRVGSVKGGTRLYISGSGFSSQGQSNNKVMIGANYECTVLGKINHLSL